MPPFVGLPLRLAGLRATAAGARGHSVHFVPIESSAFVRVGPKSQDSTIPCRNWACIRTQRKRMVGRKVSATENVMQLVGRTTRNPSRVSDEFRQVAADQVPAVASSIIRGWPRFQELLGANSAGLSSSLISSRNLLLLLIRAKSAACDMLSGGLGGDPYSLITANNF